MNSTERTRFYVRYIGGDYAVCSAYDADDALEILASSREMLHGPIAGEPPATTDPAAIDDLG